KRGAEEFRARYDGTENSLCRSWRRSRPTFGSNASRRDRLLRLLARRRLLLIGLRDAWQDRRTNFAELENFQHVLAVDRLVFEQRLGDFVQGRTMLSDDLRRAAVLLLDDAMDLRIDFARGVL